MAVVTQGEYEELEAEYKASQQQLASKDQALKIFQEQLKNSEFNSQRLQQEINQLRSQLTRVRVQLPQSQNGGEEERGVAQSISEEVVKEKERYLQELEAAQVRMSELERQVQVVEDEKAELASERDYFSGKCESLVKCLEEERSTPGPTQSTLQSAIEENKLLKLELVDVKAERDHAQSRIERYKKAVERRRAIEASASQGFQQSPGVDKKHHLQDSVKRVKELEVLANNLSETIKEKSIALLHQKKANKMLATRIAELEHKLKVVEISGLWTTSSDVIPQLNQVPLIPETVGDDISHPPVVYGGNSGTPRGPQGEIGQTTEMEENHEEMNNCRGEGNEGSIEHSVLLAEQ